mgnify:CR=1 FL=1
MVFLKHQILIWGKFEALTDCWQLHYSSTTIYNRYYNGSHTANYGQRGDKFRIYS